MVYVQYFERGLMTGDLIPACGDRSVVILDGRRSLESLKDDARKCNSDHRPKYAAFQIMRGPSILRAKPITGVIPL